MVNDPNKSLRVKVIESFNPQAFENEINNFAAMHKVHDIQTNISQRTDPLLGGTQTVYSATITYQFP